MQPNVNPTMQPMRSDQIMRAFNTTRSTVVAEQVWLALSPWRRLRGLIGTPPLQSGEALLLRPCRGIHTCFMRYPLDVLFLDRTGVVVALVRDLPPWRITPVHFRAYDTLELRGGTLHPTQTEEGDRLHFSEVPPESVSR